jgi:mevalonate pyrophosphate decarboxylase
MKQLLKLCIVIIGIAFLFILNKSENDEWSDLTYSNMEALASGEGGRSICGGYGSIDCNGYKVEVKVSYSIGL